MLARQDSADTGAPGPHTTHGGEPTPTLYHVYFENLRTQVKNQVAHAITVQAAAPTTSKQIMPSRKLALCNMGEKHLTIASKVQWVELQIRMKDKTTMTHTFKKSASRRIYIYIYIYTLLQSLPEVVAEHCSRVLLGRR